MSHSSKIGRLMGAAERSGLLKFSEALSLPKERRREQMLMRVQEIYDSAAARERQSGKGEAFPDPDHHAQVKCVELASRLMDLFTADKETAHEEADIRLVADLMRRAGWTVEPPRAA